MAVTKVTIVDSPGEFGYGYYLANIIIFVIHVQYYYQKHVICGSLQYIAIGSLKPKLFNKLQFGRINARISILAIDSVAYVMCRSILLQPIKKQFH